MSTTAPGAARRIVGCLAGHIRRRAALTRLGGGLLVVVVLAVGVTLWDLRRVVLDDALVSTDNLAIVRAITALGSAFGIVILADGVERPEQVARLRDEGCDAVQGYLFSAPRPASEIRCLLENFHPSEPQVA